MGRIILLILFLPIFSMSCALTGRGIKDYGTAGFISKSCFQAPVTVKPDDDACGLVEQRESAYLNARTADIREEALSILTEYAFETMVSNRKEIKSEPRDEQERIRGEIREELESVVKFGRVVERYFNKNAEYVLVYRIVKPGFRNRVETIDVKGHE